jgi:predicted nucleic acid-binding protein
VIVVADTSPLNYLIEIGHDSLLPKLYQRVLIPEAVLSELGDPRAPFATRKWFSLVPEWIETMRISSQSDPTLAALDVGERQAILLAQEQRADLLLIDERRGRLEAQRRGLPTTGTLGVLLAADQRGLANARAAYFRLTNETTFRSTPELQTYFLRQIKK